MQEGGQTVEKIFGAVQGSGNGQFVTYAFLDELCKNGAFETCDWSHDSGGHPDIDQDGVADTTDNCPTVANADQANCDEEAESDDSAMAKLGGRPHLGDACHPDPWSSPVFADT